MRHTCRHSTVDAVGRGGARGGLARVGEGPPQRVGLEGPLIERDLAHARHRGDDPRLHRDRAHRAHHPGGRRRVAPGNLATGERRLGGGEERVAAHRDRRRSRVRGLADEPQHVALDPVGADNRAGGSPHRLEHGPLLDVELEVRARAAPVERLARLGHAVQIDAVLGQRVHEPHALAVHQAAHAVGHETPARARRPQQAAREARALLVGEVHDGQRHRRRRALALTQRLDAREHAERTVEPAAVGHRVEVAADDDGVRPRARHRDPAVAGGVGVGAQTLSGQQVVEPAAGVTPHRAPRDTLGAMGVARPRRQGAKVGNHIACAHVVPRAVHHSGSVDM